MTTARLFIVAIFLVIFTGSQTQPTSRIVGGEDVESKTLTYTASVRVDNIHVCGGTILSENIVLTAAHCINRFLRDIKSINVRVGSINQFSGGKLVAVSHVHIHPQYTGLKNDIAILRLNEPLVWSDRITSIEYAKSIEESSNVGDEVIVAGWGQQANGVSPYKLQSTKLTVASEKECTNAFKDNDDSVVCLAHDLKQGSCIGDAGNGAVHNNKLVAVSNLIIGACGSRYPDVFANVAYFADWIDSVIAEEL